MNKVRIITKVERTLCSNLKGMLRLGENSVKLPDNIQWEEVTCREYASLSTAEKVDDKVPIYNATLKFIPVRNFKTTETMPIGLNLLMAVNCFWVHP